MSPYGPQFFGGVWCISSSITLMIYVRYQNFPHFFFIFFHHFWGLSGVPLWLSNFAQFGGPHVWPLGTSGWNTPFDVHWGQLVHSWYCVQEFWRKTRFFNEIGHFCHFYHFCLNEGCDTPTLKIRDSHRTTSGVNLRVPLPHTNPITSFDSWHPILLWPGALSDTGHCHFLT